jgi:hypothetical protein
MGRRSLLTARSLLSGIGASLVLLAAAPSAVWAQSAARHASAPAAKAAEAGPKWAELSVAQRSALKPLERDWSTIDVDRKQKWLDIAGRMPRMPQGERERIQARMTDWAQMSPQQRARTRMAYQEATEVAPQNRQAQWEAYQALPAEQRRQLAAKATPANSPAGSRPGGAQRSDRSDKSNDAQTKSNIVPNPAYAARPKPVAPTVMQARPGATTTLISKRATPPAHQQTGLPKIAATPEFVDRTTLLPQRGAQGAAARSRAASAPVQRP